MTLDPISDTPAWNVQAAYRKEWLVGLFRDDRKKVAEWLEGRSPLRLS